MPWPGRCRRAGCPRRGAARERPRLPVEPAKARRIASLSANGSVRAATEGSCTGRAVSSVASTVSSRTRVRPVRRPPARRVDGISKARRRTPGSRKRGSLRQARTQASWVASRASGSLRVMANASRSAGQAADEGARRRRRGRPARRAPAACHPGTGLTSGPDRHRPSDRHRARDPDVDARAYRLAGSRYGFGKAYLLRTFHCEPWSWTPSEA